MASGKIVTVAEDRKVSLGGGLERKFPAGWKGRVSAEIAKKLFPNEDASNSADIAEGAAEK